MCTFRNAKCFSTFSNSVFDFGIADRIRNSTSIL